MRNESPRVESVHRALRLLRVLIEEQSLSVGEAAALLGVNASTASRLLATLAFDGFAEQGADRRYVVGPILAASPLTPTGQVTTALRPALEALYQRTGETVHLATLAGTRIQHLDGIEASAQFLRFGLRVGMWLPAHLTSGGKAMLADLPDDEVRARFAQSPSAQDVDVDALLRELHEVRTTRVAWAFEESELGLAAMAVSVGRRHGHHAAVSIAVPSARYTRSKAEEWGRHLRAVADEVASTW